MNKDINSLKFDLKNRLPITTAYFNLTVEGKTLEALWIRSSRIISIIFLHGEDGN